jgi:hypothetical protein
LKVIHSALFTLEDNVFGVNASASSYGTSVVTKYFNHRAGLDGTAKPGSRRKNYIFLLP